MKLLFLSLFIATSAFAQEAVTYKIKVPKKPYATGLVKHEKPKQVEAKFALADEALPPRFHLKERAELAPIKNQGSCGSCVYFSVMAQIEDTYRVRGVVLPKLSPQFIMDCGAPWSCNGSFFEKVAPAVVEQGGTAKDDAYPYRARDQRCQGKPAELLGTLESAKLISPTPKSIATALYAGYAVAVTVGADGSWQSYGGGTYNGCRNASTNHEVVIEGYDLEGGQFDSRGFLPAGVGTWSVRNSWGTGWGDDGWMTSKMTDRNGRLCNNLAEEAGIIEPTVEPKPPGPTPGPDDDDKKPFNLPAWVYIALGIVAAFLLGRVLAKYKIVEK